MIATATYLIALNAPAPWDGFRLLLKSTPELAVAGALAAIAAAACVWRLPCGSKAGSESRQLGDAIAGGDDPGSSLAAIDDASD